MLPITKDSLDSMQIRPESNGYSNSLSQSELFFFSENGCTKIKNFLIQNDLKQNFLRCLNSNKFAYNKSQKYSEIKNMQLCPQEDKMLQEEIDLLLLQKQEQTKKNSLTYKNVSIWNDANYQPSKVHETNKHNFNTYADKLLVHLVIEEKFDFHKISQIMSYTFHYQPKKYSEQVCRERWYELHRDREILSQIKQKQMENKRIKSIMGMSDPFLLYDIDQKLHQMKKDEEQQTTQSNQLQCKYEGYNIFKDSIRKIDDFDKYNQLHKQMKSALEKASKSIQLQKPMLYTPYYERLEQFQVIEEELTVQKMQQMMSHPIEMQLMERELKVLDLNERNFQSRIKKDVQKKVKKEKIKNEQEFQIEEDWDEYESD